MISYCIIVIILYYIDIELPESTTGNYPFSSMLFTLSSLVNGQQLICMNATDTRNSTF